MNRSSITVLIILAMTSSTYGEEVLEVISSSPDKRYEVAIVYPSQAAKDEDKANFPSQANYGSRPVVLIDRKTGQRVPVGGIDIAQVIDVNWLPKTPGFGYYERDEANWIHHLYLIDTAEGLSFRQVILPDLKALVLANGDDPQKHYDTEFEFLSQELGDYGTEGVIEVLLVTRWQYGRAGRTSTLSYTARFTTTDYKSFDLAFLKREQHPMKQEPLPDKVLFNKPKPESKDSTSIR